MYEMVLDKKILYHASQGGELEIIFLLGGRVGRVDLDSVIHAFNGTCIY